MVGQSARALTQVQFTDTRQLATLGIAIALFFQCMVSLLDPASSMKPGIKWGLVAHTVTMFVVLTMSVVINLGSVPPSWIDYRYYPGNDETFPGPVGYQVITWDGAINVVARVLLPFGQFLVDGLLVGPATRPAIQRSNSILTPSCTVATLSMPGTTWSWRSCH
jgi:hypothetical protein